MKDILLVFLWIWVFINVMIFLWDGDTTIFDKPFLREGKIEFKLMTRGDIIRLVIELPRVLIALAFVMIFDFFFSGYGQKMIEFSKYSYRPVKNWLEKPVSNKRKHF